MLQGVFVNELRACVIQKNVGAKLGIAAVQAAARAVAHAGMSS
jgi:hypothetical protein